MRSKASKQSKFMQITKAPIRILCKARDFYVRNMLDFADSGKVGYGSVGDATNLPRSYSVNCLRDVDDEEFKQLLRLLSKKGSEMEEYMRSYSRKSSEMRRNYSVGVGKIGRIDEDRTCSFRENDEDANQNSYIRSTSQAIGRKVVHY